MAKRFVLIAVVLAAVLVVAAPALAFNGAREDYTPSSKCADCHTDMASIPQVYGEWAETKHAESNADGQSTRWPNGNTCAGCHTSNFDPSKAEPVASSTAAPTATPTPFAVSWINGNASPDPAAQATGNASMSELAVGCSSCHQGQSAAHAAPLANLANADICGQCHSQFSYTVDTYKVTPLPYITAPNGTPATPNPRPTSIIQPRMAVGYEPMGDAAGGWAQAPLTTKLNIPTPGWSPTPNPQATTAAAGSLQTYWTSTEGEVLPWSQSGHDGNAQQYVEWAGPADLHAKALENLKKVMGPNPPAACLECHSTDYIIAPEDEKPTGAEAKYGITCVGCHDPHEKGTAKGVWESDFTPQLRYDSAKLLCTSCHNAELDGKIATPGSTVHHPMKEMMEGVGAIDVMQGSPSVHKGKCVQCHMPPTTVSSRAGVELGANHTFKIIEPEVAANVKSLTVGSRTFTEMPFSACSTCHSRPNDQPAMWVQDTLTYRQEAMHRWVDQVTAALTKAARKLGYKDIATANAAINKKPMKTWTKNQMRFQKSFTNQSYVVSEGSWGIHNWDYARTVVLTALDQARAVNGK